MIETTFRGGIAVLRLEHGPVNALDPELLAALVASLAEVEESDSIAAVLTGSGPAFSAGADLFRVLDEGSGYVVRARPHATAAFRQLFLFPKPIVAAVNGHAIAGGCVLALACDHRITVSGDHRLGLPELKVGVPFPVWALEIVRFAVAPPHLQRLIFSGRLLTPDDALTAGLVDEIAAPDELIERAVRIAERLASIPPATFRLTKRTLREPFAARARRGDAIDDEGLAAWTSQETRDSMRRFIDRTLGSS